VEIIKAHPLQYITAGVKQTWANTAITYTFLWRIITREVSLRDNTAGPIGIAVILAEAVKIGFAYLIYIVAHINLALAVFNLLPFPILDGGHIMFLGLEKIRRKPLSFKTQEVIQYGAMSILIAFFLFVSYNDIMVQVFKR
jgi:regulator of sigma E protease